MRTAPLRHLADVRTSSVDKHTHRGELPVQLCNYTDVYRNDKVRPGPDLMRATASSEEVARFRLKVGDSVLTKDSEDPNDIGVAAHVAETASDFVCGYHLAIVRPSPGTHPRYLTWALRSRPVLDHFSNHASGISRYGLTSAGLRAAPVPWHDELGQRRIADFLDDRVAHIDQIITARRLQMSLLAERANRESFDAITGAAISCRRDSGLKWLGSIPEQWPVLPVAKEFQVDLGKMLDEKRQTGASAVPYLRNTNVQWDRVDVTDLKRMDIPLAERDRYCVRAGDLLICEGGHPGRAAIWSGGITILGYQKALHRARSRGRSRPDWLLECLRVATNLNVFAIENEQTTIGHLTHEQLRAMRFPFPEQEMQSQIIDELSRRRAELNDLLGVLGTSIDTLSEYKQALITAAVTGEIDVTTAGSGIPG